MKIAYLTYLLEEWAKWLQQDDVGIGYPKQSVGFLSGGSSSSFDEMFESSELEKIKTLDTVVNSLDKNQKEAIYARYTGSKKPFRYEVHLSLAIDNCLTILGRRLNE